jgi:hypothetical protein
VVVLFGSWFGKDNAVVIAAIAAISAIAAIT